MTDPPAGPHFHKGFGLTLWHFLKHVVANGDNREHVASAAAALRRVYEALAYFRDDELPSFRNKIDKCRTLPEDQSALTALLAADRKFLLMVYNRILTSLDALPLNLVPIHGDASQSPVAI